MFASCLKRLPLYSSEINVQIIDLLSEQSEQILVLEKEKRELKCEAGYWHAMHNKAIAREKILKQKINSTLLPPVNRLWR